MFDDCYGTSSFFTCKLAETSSMVALETIDSQLCSECTRDF